MGDSSRSADSSNSSTDSSDEIVVRKPKAPSKPSVPPKTVKKRKNTIAVCLTSCRYEVIRKVANKFGYKEVTEGDNWNLFWTDLSITVERCKEMKRYQKINHFPGMLEICRKDLLARNLNRMLRLFPKDYNFFPRTWCLPADLGEALTYSRLRKNKTFILKPDAGSQGRGIYVTKTLKDIRPCDRGVCQVYISRPFLIDGYKFDLRIYTLITACDPLRIYVFDEGLVRFATTRYKEPNSVNVSNVFMHLTNYAVNKYSRTYNQDTEEGSKRKLSWFNSYLRKQGHDVESIWMRIDDVIIKTIISAAPILKHSYTACFPNHDVIPACCELLGVDILLDRRLNPHILEINHSPSFHTDTSLDWEIKESLLTDMFSMMNLDKCDKRKVMREDRKRIRERLIHGKDHQPPIIINFDDFYKQEMSKKGNFRLVYPIASTKLHYNKYFDQGTGSLYCETASSRAREAAQNALRDEMQLKARLEAAKRVSSMSSTRQIVKKIESPPKAVSRVTNAQPVYSSSEPQMIVESEERDRLQKLAQREYLLRSHGILEHVYFFMKKNGNLRPRDEKKFAIFEKLLNCRDGGYSTRTNNTLIISDLVESIKTRQNV